MDYSIQTTSIKNEWTKACVKKITWFKSTRDCYNGWGNGYVEIPKGHPLYKKDMHDMELYVHGGITFAQTIDDPKQFNDIFNKGAFVVGFDTMHGGDNSENWSKEQVIFETNRLIYLLFNGMYK